MDYALLVPLVLAPNRLTSRTKCIYGRQVELAPLKPHANAVTLIGNLVRTFQVCLEIPGLRYQAIPRHRLHVSARRRQRWHLHDVRPNVADTIGVFRFDVSIFDCSPPIRFRVAITLVSPGVGKVEWSPTWITECHPFLCGICR